MAYNTNNNGGSFKAMNILHLGLLGGLFLFAVVSLYLVYTGSFPPSMQDNEQLLQVGALALAGLGIFFGNRIFKSRMLAIQDMPTAKEKIAFYQTANIVRWALIEGAALFSIICFMLTANYAFLALAVALIILLMVLKPTKEKIFIQTGISGEELDKL